MEFCVIGNVNTNALCNLNKFVSVLIHLHTQDAHVIALDPCVIRVKSWSFPCETRGFVFLKVYAHLQ